MGLEVSVLQWPLTTTSTAHDETSTIIDYYLSQLTITSSPYPWLSPSLPITVTVKIFPLGIGVNLDWLLPEVVQRMNRISPGAA